MPPLAPTAPASDSKSAPAVPVIPFTRAASEHTEPLPVDDSRVLLTNSQNLGPYDVPAYGFLRHILVVITTTGGVGAATAKEDAPWCALETVQLTDVNGQTIVALSGYELFLANKWGGYANWPNPTDSPFYTNTIATNGMFSFALRVPVEISLRDGLGALINQNSASAYKLSVTLTASTNIYSASPSTLPTVRIRAWQEAWTQPPAVDQLGRAQQTNPPAAGTTQFWTRTTRSGLGAGQQSILLPRTGNYIRELILIARDATPSRQTANLPDPIQLVIDGRILNNQHRDIQRHYMVERTGLPASALDAGVVVFDFAHDFDGQIGNEMRDGYLLTSQASRIELVGSFGAGSLTIITNDVAPKDTSV